MLFVFPHTAVVHFLSTAATVATVTGPPETVASVRNYPVIVCMYPTPGTHTGGYNTSQNQKQYPSVMHIWLFWSLSTSFVFFLHMCFLIDASAASPSSPHNQAETPPGSEIVTQEPLNLSKPNKAKHSPLHTVNGHIPGSFYLFGFKKKKCSISISLNQYFLYILWPAGGVLI